jgi:hypothetical protein
MLLCGSKDFIIENSFNTKTNKTMEETIKVVAAILGGVLYFWLLSRRKQKTNKPDETQAPETKKLVVTPRKKTNFAKILESLEEGKDVDLKNVNPIALSKTEIRTPSLLIKKERKEELSINQERKLKAQEKALQQMKEGGNKRASEKDDNFTSTVDADDAMNKEREKAYKLQQNAEHPIIKLTQNTDDIKNAIIMAEILQRKY